MHWFLFFVLSALCVWVVVGNAATVLAAWFAKRGGSLAPLIGGLSGMLALLIAPIPGWRAWWWVPLVLDLGSLPLLLACLPAACAWIVQRRKQE